MAGCQRALKLGGCNHHVRTNAAIAAQAVMRGKVFMRDDGNNSLGKMQINFVFSRIELLILTT
jgi:hypothetical protein